MSRATTAQIDSQLTQYAQGLALEQAAAQVVPRALMPIVQVPTTTGQFKRFDDRNALLTYDTSRGLGGAARRISFEATDGTYACKAQALDIGLDDEELKGGLEGLEQIKVRTLVNRILLSHAKKVVDFCVANTTAVPDRGNWSNKDIDPIEQIDEQIKALAKEVGSTQGINVVIGVDALFTLRHHPKVKARAQGIQLATVQASQLAGLFMFKNVNVVDAVLTYTSSKEGQGTVTKSQVLGDNVIICYSSPNPTQYDPSAFKCFSTSPALITGIRRTRDDLTRSDVFLADWDEDMQVTGSAAVRRLAIS